jgi:hypothetical protein
MDYKDINFEQKLICIKYNAEFLESPTDKKIGISDNIKDGVLPINGLRINPEIDTTGWYIWAGEELSKKKDFFKPLHISHLKIYCPEIEKYLGMAPGWRFLIADDYVDIWFDKDLINEVI